MIKICVLINSTFSKNLWNIKSNKIHHRYHLMQANIILCFILKVKLKIFMPACARKRKAVRSVPICTAALHALHFMCVLSRTIWCRFHTTSSSPLWQRSNGPQCPSAGFCPSMRLPRAQHCWLSEAGPWRQLWTRPSWSAIRPGAGRRNWKTIALTRKAISLK